MLKSCSLVLPLLLLILASCGPRSLDDFVEEGDGVVRSLVQELQSIHTRDHLLASTSKLKKLFDRLADIMIAAQEYANSHPELNKSELIRPNHEISDQLRIELNRLYKLEGGCQIIEKCQENALQKLEKFKLKK